MIIPKPKLPKILIVFSAPIVFSQHLREIIALLSKNYSIHVCTNLSDNPSYFTSHKETSEYYAYSAPFSRRLSPFADIITVVRLIRLISINKYSFVLSFTPKAGLVSSIAILLCALLLHRPVFFHYFTGLLWPHLNFSSPIRIFLSFCDWLIISASSRVFCDSPSQEMTLRHAFPSSVSKISCIGHGSLKGVDTNLFKPSLSLRKSLRRSLSIQDSDFVVLYLGRITADKGIASLILAHQISFSRNSSI